MDGAFWEKREFLGQKPSLPVGMCLKNSLAFSMSSSAVGVHEEPPRSTYLPRC